MSYMRVGRAFIQGRLGVAAPLLALAVVSAAFVLIANGSIAVGCIVLLLGILSTWLSGLWVVPYGVDAYVRRMTHLLRSDFAEATRESRQQVERMQNATAAIVQLEPPHELVELHARLLGILQEIDNIKQDEPQMLVDRTVQIFGLRQQLLQARKELDGYAAEPYIVELADAVDARIAVASETAEAIQRPLQHQSKP